MASPISTSTAGQNNDDSKVAKAGAKKDALCRQRLLRDYHEFLTNPYPKVAVIPYEDDISRACLVLCPDDYHPLHLTLAFPDEYPVKPPVVHMNSEIHHPNVAQHRVCASVLAKHYTPAYTLEDIAVQLLSLFDSDHVEHGHGSRKNLKGYRHDNARWGIPTRAPYCSEKNPFGAWDSGNPFAALSISDRHSSEEEDEVEDKMCHIARLPNELLLLILESIDDLRHFDIIHRRELQCFVLKKTYKTAKLGVGICVEPRSSLEPGLLSESKLSCEFELLSEEAFRDLGVRRSIHRLEFQHWLPLPLSRNHWLRARVLFTLMDDVAVKLNGGTEQMPGDYNNDDDDDAAYRILCDVRRSTQRFASEKAVEAYFHLFHLLLCFAVEDPAIVTHANTLLHDFQTKGKTSKKDCPNLGHLLIALLVSDVAVTEGLIKDIITEAITRNVVWMLDRRGANMPELAYLEERTEVCRYRLEKTFEASKTSYRLLMFSELFRRTVRPSSSPSPSGGEPCQTLVEIRDALFDPHGAPPGAGDTAARLAEEVRRIQSISSFPPFLRKMGLSRHNIPSAARLAAMLRGTVEASMQKGYSSRAIDQQKAFLLRLVRDPVVAREIQPDGVNSFLVVEEREKRGKRQKRECERMISTKLECTVPFRAMRPHYFSLYRPPPSPLPTYAKILD
ncbi:hypothetical protein F5Y17DRAFT_467905 [Xylariaceae sp. FL0594]|nr:hypothetical protein F5Y17DRAFT_467905 [Xylariaceae sp. FL0594]